MDRNLTLYQLSPERAAKIFDRIDVFNRGRTETNGKYVISMPTPIARIMGSGEYSSMIMLHCLYVHWP